MLMKVGLYAGIFLATPVLLSQLWGFVAPGLYPRERKYAFPFVLLGTLAFLIGATFCYLVVLPTMFNFLLSSGNTAPIKARVERARAMELEALRFARSGDFDRAASIADGEAQRLTRPGRRAGVGAGPVRRRRGRAAGPAGRRGPAGGRDARWARPRRRPGAAPGAGEAGRGGGGLRVGRAREVLRGAGAVRLAPRRRGGKPGLAGGPAVEDAEDARRRSELAVGGGLDPAAAHHERAAVAGADAAPGAGGGVRAAAGDGAARGARAW